MSFDDLYERYDRYVRYLVRQRMYNPWLADDAVQEAWIRIWTHYQEHGEMPKSWVRRMTIHAALSMMRAQQRHTRADGGESLEPLACSLPTPEQEVASRDERARALAALETLSEPVRETATAFYLEGRKLREIAEDGTPMGTLTKRLHTARRRLRAALMD